MELRRIAFGMVFGVCMALMPGALMSQAEAASTSCDKLVCTPLACCTIDSATGEICDCEPLG